MKKDRLKKAAIVLWVFIHTILLILGIIVRSDQYNYYEAFRKLYPFQADYIHYYDFSEFVIYVITPVLLYYLFRYVKGDKIPFIK